jgi:hypothetical protein
MPAIGPGANRFISARPHAIRKSLARTMAGERKRSSRLITLYQNGMFLPQCRHLGLPLHVAVKHEGACIRYE